jgi:DNA polymerase-3 subunit chi
MTAVQFYHLTSTPLERALPKLLEKAVAGGFKTLLVADSEEYAERLNELLWTYDAGSFLPHGSIQEPNPEAQPVLVSTTMEPVNGANLLVVTNGAIPDNNDQFGRIIDIFDGSNPQIVEKARARWTSYKQTNCEMTYMRQTDSGGWEKKA